MNKQENIELQPLTKEDIRPLTSIMTRAFDNDTRIHLGEERGGPDGYDDGRLLMKWGLHSPTESFKVLLNGILIGGVILWIRENGKNYLGTIFIDPPFQGRGIGTRIWGLIESKYTDTKAWMTDTPTFATRNHHFYVQKLGFTVVGIKNPGKQKEEAYIFEKRMQ
ncbi:MAG: Acetyltransferase (GNAT) family protein [Methanosaeta sp. PtaU1.Bin060]|jgi:GNAT superfamily N-acetyltransferase|nr:MAG: Acetyltransferase (GNAT) family protein [Methanosaeta sp. PtaU1.Bin060]